MDLTYDKPREDYVQDPEKSTPSPGLSIKPQAPAQEGFPVPPPGYAPGPTSATKMFDEESAMYKIGTTLMSISQQAPVHMKLKLAQREADLKESENKLAWDNYYKSAKQHTLMMEKHNQEAMMAGLEALPKLKYQISQIEDPGARERFVEMHAKTYDRLNPGGGDFLRYFAKNPSSVYDGDDLLDDPEYGPMAKELSARMGYERYMTSKEREELSATRNHDRFDILHLNHFTDDDSHKLAEGKMKEADFRKAHAAASKDAFERGKMTQRGMLSAKLYLNTPEGQEQMAQLGVQTDKAALAHQIKQKEAGTVAQQQDKEFQARQAILDDPDRTKKYNPAYLSELQESQQISMKQMQPRSNPSDSPNNEFNQRLEIESKGRIRSVGDIAKLPKAEQAPLYAMADNIRAEQDRAKAQGAVHAREEGSADLTDVYDLREFRKSGKLVPMTGDVSIKELRSGKDMRKLGPKVVDEIKTYNTLNENYQNIFNDARKAYPSDAGYFNKKGRTGAEALIQAAASDPTSIIKAEAAASASESFPELAAYLSARESVLGKFARSVSGEVGVLTDQDAGRVRGLFPRSGDTPGIIRAKEKAMKRLMELNGKFMRESVAGVDPSSLRATPAYRSTVEGIFGSVSGLTQKGSSGKTGVDQLGADMVKP